MSAEQVTPLDEVTGIPLPLMPRDDLPPVPTGKMRNTERLADWHHPFHPRAALLGEGVGAVAIRNCRIQWAEYDDHHHKYHGAYVGPELPTESEDQFSAVVFAAAGYIPDRAIAFDRSNKPQIKLLGKEKREHLWQSGQIRIGNMATVRDFMLAFTLERDFGGVNESTIDEFLHTQDVRRKKELGSTILAIAAYDAAQPVEDMYKQSRKLHLLPPNRARTAGRFVFGAMSTHKRARALTALTNRFAA